MLTKILEVHSVSIEPVKKNPSQFKITAAGLVTTGGWNEPRLIPYSYLNPPPDGIYDFDFVAEAPDPKDVVTMVMTKINVDFIWEKQPAELNGVRVHASKNWMVAP
ncbi:MAG: hypothetical protein ONB16_09065 [candidate division KSB1 bacterium]|nr:hypothetical protein [candidate division KSB1 bacterium]MDZ7319178.1 hypothetical protein [candidate division KSB1 bacterium]MDZ7339769.1 hypothetical protein [candidate division KSB1 bacterium]